MNLEGKKIKMLISMTKLVNKKHFVVRYSVLNRYQIHCNCAIINVDFAISLFDCARWYSYQYDGLKLQHLTYTLVTFSKNTTCSHWANCISQVTMFKMILSFHFFCQQIKIIIICFIC